MTEQAWRVRWARVPATVVDAGLGMVFLAAMVTERVTRNVPLQPLAILLSLVIATGLALRRRVPLTGFLIGSLALSVESLALTPSPVSPYANLIGIFSVSLYATRRRAWWGPILLPIGVVAYDIGLDKPGWALPAGVIFSWLLAWALGYSMARRREEQQVAQRLLRDQVAAEERARMARELHDLIGHTVNVMLVQVGAARRVLDNDRERSRELLSTVEASGRGALDELDRVLGLLRRDGAAPGLGDLPDLARRLGEAGIAVVLDIESGPTSAAAAVELAAYRIVQEALTNALKHGRAASATVTVRRAGDRLTVEVCDEGRGPAPGYAAGRGLLGIAERAAQLGGTLEHGPQAGQGFRVRAELRLS